MITSQRQGSSQSVDAAERTGEAISPEILRQAVLKPASATVAIVGKGGAGKSSTAVNIAVAAKQAGFRAAILDLDPQQSALAWRRIRGCNDIPVRRCLPEELSGTIDEAMQAGVEVVIIDMPPDLRQVPIAAHVADLVLIPTRPTYFDIVVTKNVAGVLASARKAYGVVITGAPPLRDGIESPMVREARAALADIGTHLWSGQITHRLAIPYAALRGQAAAHASIVLIDELEHGLEPHRIIMLLGSWGRRTARRLFRCL